MLSITLGAGGFRREATVNITLGGYGFAMFRQETPLHVAVEAPNPLVPNANAIRG